MAGFISALIKQRRDAKKAAPDTRGRLNEIVGIVRKQDYSDGITPKVLVGILQDLGPTFVKLGQLASQQSEHIPPEYCDALAKLRSSVAPMDAETVHSQIEKHLGKTTEELFASFEDEPLGSASIGQVHKAELFDGSTVVVKVRRPGVVETTARDFALLEQVIDTFAKNGIGGIDVKGFILELEKTSRIELDFTNEAANLERFGKNNADRPGVEVPRCHRELTNEAILTEDFVTGKEVGDADYVASLDEDEREGLAALIADNFASQVLVDGFYHADPHSGNVLINEPAAGAVAPEGTSHSIEWIDFGMMGVLTVQQRRILLDIATSVVMQDAYSLKRTLLKTAKPVGDIDHGEVLEICEGLCSQYDGSDFGDFDLADLLGTIIASLQNEAYKIDPFLTNLARGIVAVEGTVKALSPRVNILNHFVDKADIGPGIDFDNLDEASLEELKGPLAMELVKFLHASSNSATGSAEALDMLVKGQIGVRTDVGFEHKALESVEQMVKSVVWGLMAVGLFIGSCLLCTVPPDAMEGTNLPAVFPIMGFVGYIVSLWFAFFLYRSMKKGKRGHGLPGPLS